MAARPCPAVAIVAVVAFPRMEVRGPEAWEEAPPSRQQPPLGAWPGSLMEVTLKCGGILGGLRALPHLGGVTKLRIAG